MFLGLSSIQSWSWDVLLFEYRPLSTFKSTYIHLPRPFMLGPIGPTNVFLMFRPNQTTTSRTYINTELNGIYFISQFMSITQQLNPGTPLYTSANHLREQRYK